MRSNPLTDALDDLTWGKTMLIFLVLTFGSAVLYYSAPFVDKGSAILPTFLHSNDTSESYSFSNSLYFSIVTEATLGYGDYRPVGYCRAVAVLQVLTGYALFGLMIAKLTSSFGAKYRRIQRLVCGHWYNYTIHEHNRRITIDICEVYPSAIDGGLRWSGSNYESNGKVLGTYQAYLIEADWPNLKFVYNNSPGNDLPWSKGIMDIQFMCDENNRRAYSFNGTCEDFRGGITYFHGRRIERGSALLSTLGSPNELLMEIKKLANELLSAHENVT